VPERHNGLGSAGAGAKILDDPLAQPSGGIAGQDRNSLGVEENHAGPPDPAQAAVARDELHDEEIALVVERVRDVFEIRKRFPAKRLQELQVLLAPLEGLFHRDHAVPEHACLRHVELLSSGFSVQSYRLHPIVSPLSLKISLAMMSRWISLVPS
jgi:hypothetical protein